MINFFIKSFNILLHQPLFNALVLLYLYLPGHDFGIATIVLTILIRLLLYPVMGKSIRAQKILSELQVKIKDIQKKYKDDKAKQTKEIIALYQKEKINPFGIYFPLLIQFPILIALYRVFWNGLSPELLKTHLYSFVPNPGALNPMFLGVLDLSKSFYFKIGGQGQFYWPVLILAVLAGVLQFYQSKMLISKNEMSQSAGSLQKQSLYFFPLLTVFLLTQFPAALGIYWITTTLFSIFQQWLVLKKKPEPAL